MAWPETRAGLFHLRRHFHQQHLLRRTLLEPAMWVNVTLLVLMFVILHSSYVLQPGIEVNLPATAMTGGAPFGSHVVTVSKELLSEARVYFEDQRMTHDVFAARLEQAVHGDPSRPLMVEADESVSYRDLVKIYNIAIGAGITNVVLATRIGSGR